MTSTLDRLGEGVEGRRTASDLGSASDRRRRFRADIQGLRAVAVTLVVLYHCGISFVPGGYVGVDVFFVISGFLITSHLVDEADRTGRVSWAGFYARRIRRLLPAALLVVATTLVVARLWGPALQSSRTAWDALFATFYGMNYRLADQGVDYQLADGPPSPFQHFWSLAVEEQFYVLWPLLLGVVVLVTRRAGRVRRVLLALVLTAVVAASLAASIAVTESNAPLAYYSLHTRAWELGVGALVAVLLPLLTRLWGLVGALMSWVGMAAVIATAVQFDDTTPFPGVLAAIPVLGAALVVAGGACSPRLGVVTVLRGRIVQLVGHVSYGWYLWHWPFLVLAPDVFGIEFSWVENLQVSFLALWAAIVTFLVVEQPSQRTRSTLRRWVPTAAGLSAFVAGLVVLALVFAPRVQGDGASVTVLDLDDPATARITAALADGLEMTDLPANLDPGLEAAADDVPATTDAGCHLGFLETRQPACVFGDPTADRTVVLFGDSHAEQWFGAMDEFARDHGWRLVSWTKAACPVADVVLENENLDRTYTECAQWREERLAAIESMRPEMIVASQADTLAGGAFDDRVWADRTTDTLRRLSDVGPLAYLTDTPRPDVDVPACLADHSSDVGRCVVPAGAARGAGGTFGFLAERTALLREQLELVDLTILDTSDWMCVEGACPPVLGNVLVYRDASHVTDTFSRRMAPLIALALTDATTGAPS